MTEQAPEPAVIDAGGITVSSTDIQAVQIAPPPIICGQGDHGILWAIRPDGRVELGDGYTPEEAAASFWEAVQRLVPDSMTREFGAPLRARIDAELAAGQRARKQVERLDAMAAAWAERLPDTVRTATVVEAIHQVTREGAE